jgi:cystathionine gamma-synthase
MTADEYGFDTLAIHAGQDPDPRTGSVVPPIYQTSTYAQDAVGSPRLGYEYSRSSNPTRDALQECLAAIEGGRRGLAFASGLAAEDALLRALCRPGDHVVIPSDAYGGTYRLFAKVAEKWGLDWTAVPLGDHDAVRAAFRPGHTRMIWAETPTNPLLSIADIAGLAGLAHEYDALLAVDNTFASPYLQQPLGLGADVVIHSTTKYLGGHTDVIGGALVAADDGLGDELAFHQNAMGAVNGPVRRLADPARRPARWASGWTGTATTPSGSSPTWRVTARYARCCTRASSRIRGTRPRPSRCAGSAGWCRSASPAVMTRRSTSATGRGCSCSPSRSVAWSR